MDVVGKIYTYPNDIMEKINVFGVPLIMSKEVNNLIKNAALRVSRNWYYLEQNIMIIVDEDISKTFMGYQRCYIRPSQEIGRI